MAKKNKKQPGIPKRIAGVKVPKELRRSGGSMLQMAQTPIIREIIASGLVAAAAAIVAPEDVQKKGRKAKRNMRDWAGAGAQEASDAAQAAGAALSAAMDKWLGGSLHWQPAGDETARAPDKPAAKEGPTAH